MSRRMLPQDIKTLLPRSDIYDICMARGCAQEMESFLTQLLLDGQMWGGVVGSDDGNTISCFGSAIFIEDNLAKQVAEGKYPFLLADLCRDVALRSRILTFKDIYRLSRADKLNFYGALFCFADPRNIVQFGSDMNRMQVGVVNMMSGFGLRTYFKQTYEPKFLNREFKNFALRAMFGAEKVTDYPDIPYSERATFRPTLYMSSHEKAKLKPNLPVSQLVRRRIPGVKFSQRPREVLRLVLEGYSTSEIAHHLNMTSNENVLQSIDKGVEQAFRVQQVAFQLEREMARKGISKREAVRQYVAEHLEVLGVLHPLTWLEKENWKKEVNIRRAV